MNFSDHPQAVSVEELLKTIGFLYFQSQMQIKKIQQLENENNQLKIQLQDTENP